jgi:hypothetical protein
VLVFECSCYRSRHTNAVSSKRDLTLDSEPDQRVDAEPRFERKRKI